MINSHYVAAQTLSRLIQFVFWVFTHDEFHETENSDEKHSLVIYHLKEFWIFWIQHLSSFFYKHYFND